MKKILTFLFCLAVVYTNGQIYVNPNSTFGTQEFRRAILSTFHYPTGCGIPTDSTYLNEPGIKVRQNQAAIYYDSCGHHAYNWDPALRSWSLLGSGGSGIGVDSIYNRTDSAFYRLNGIEKFAFLIGGDTLNLSHRVDTLSTTVFAALAAKIGNFLGVSYIGYGSHAARPTSGTGLYYDTDSASFFRVNGASYTNLFPSFNVTVLGKGGPGDTTLVSASGGNLLVAAVRDSTGGCIGHVVNPDGSWTLYSTCALKNYWDSVAGKISPHGSTDTVIVNRLVVNNRIDQTYTNATAGAFNQTGFNGTDRNNAIGTTGSTINGIRRAYTPNNSTFNLDIYNAYIADLSSTPLATINTATGYSVLLSGSSNWGAQNGVSIINGIGGTNRKAYATNLSAGSGNYAFYSSADAPSLFGGAVGINQSGPNASALLDIVSTSKGILAPRMTTAQMLAIASPAGSLLVFNTDSTSALLGGYYYYDGVGSVWRPMSKASGSGGGADSGITAGYGIGVDRTSPTLRIVRSDTGSTANSLKKAFLPLNLEAAKTINQHNFDINYTGGGRVIFDSTKYTQSYTNPIIASLATRILNAGNSIGAGAQSSVIDSAYPNRVSRAVSLPLTNIAVPGIKSYDIIGILLASENIAHSNFTMMEAGLNNLRASASTNVFNSITEAFGSGIVNHFLNYYVSGSDASVTRTGTWTPNYPINGAGFGKTSTAAYSNNHIGDHADWTSPASTSIALQISGNVGSGAVVTVVIDGATMEVIDTRNQVETGSYTPMARVYTGLANTTHAVTLTNTGGNGLFILDYLGTLVTNPILPFVVIDVPYLNFSNGTAAGSDTKIRTDTVNNRLTALVARMQSKGLSVFHAITNNYYTAAPGVTLYSDDVHPTDGGHGQIAQSITAPLFTASYTDGTIVHGNDGYFYGSKNAVLNRFAYQPEINVQTTFTNGSTMTGPTYWNGNNFTGSFNNFSSLYIDSMLRIQNTGTKNTSFVTVYGQFRTIGTTAGWQLFSRNGDTLNSGFQYTVGGNTFSLGDLQNAGRNLWSTDTSFWTRFINDPNSVTNRPSATFRSTVAIDGNLRGLPGKTSLKLGYGKKTTIAEVGAFEADSVTGGLMFTNLFGNRYRIDSPTVAGASPPFSDVTALVKNSADVTKQLKISSVNITTATTRTLTAPDFDGIIAVTNHAQTITGAWDMTAATVTVATGAAGAGGSPTASQGYADASSAAAIASLPAVLSGSATLSFPATAPQTSSDLTITVTGATQGDVVALGTTSNAYSTSGVPNCYTAFVSATNTVTIRYNNYGLAGTITPAPSQVFKVKVFK